MTNADYRSRQSLRVAYPATMSQLPPLPLPPRASHSFPPNSLGPARLHVFFTAWHPRRGANGI